jgi:hypothetical protein
VELWELQFNINQMKKYFLAKFYRYIPTIEGMKVLGGIDNFNTVEITSDSALAQLTAHPDEIPFIELTELEVFQGVKFYGETRGYRKAYSDVEGLEPDADELEKGSRKTKVYITPEIEAATISLMKKAFNFHIDDEMACRECNELDFEGKQRPAHSEQRHIELKAIVDGLTTIEDIVEKRETILGIEMCKDLAKKKGLWDEERNTRINKVIFGLQF